MKAETSEDLIPGKLYKIIGLTRTMVGMYIKPIGGKMLFIIDGKNQYYFAPENSYFAYELIE